MKLDLNLGNLHFGRYPATDYVLHLTSVIYLPIEWQVLKMNREKREALLISRRVLDWNGYFPGEDGWKDSHLRKWLNDEFFADAFSVEEQQYLVPRHNGDRIFVLSKDQIEQYFPQPERRKTFAMVVSDTDDADTKILSADKWDYWTSTINTDGAIVCVDIEGHFVTFGSYADEIGIRPAIVVKYC